MTRASPRLPSASLCALLVMGTLHTGHTGVCTIRTASAHRPHSECAHGESMRGAAGWGLDRRSHAHAGQHTGDGATAGGREGAPGEGRGVGITMRNHTSSVTTVSFS